MTCTTQAKDAAELDIGCEYAAAFGIVDDGIVSPHMIFMLEVGMTDGIAPLIDIPPSIGIPYLTISGPEGSPERLNQPPLESVWFAAFPIIGILSELHCCFNSSGYLRPF